MHNGADPRVPHGQARPRARGRPVALPVDRGLDRLGAALLPRAHASGSRTTRRARSRGRSGFVEATGRRHGVEHPIQMTVATTNGEEHVGLPLLERGQLALALLQHRGPRASRPLPGHADVPEAVDDETRLVVSEPLGDLAGAWNEVPESSWGVVQPGQDRLRGLHRRGSPSVPAASGSARSPRRRSRTERPAKVEILPRSWSPSKRARMLHAEAPPPRR